VSLGFYFDEDSMDEDVIGPLRRRGVDVETTQEASMLERSDEEQLAYAAAQNRVVVTSNAGDFARLHRDALSSGQSHAGIIIVLQSRLSIGEIIRRLFHLAQTRTPAELQNELIYLTSVD
jgi:hypothetical protein